MNTQAELLRLISNIIRIGTVIEIDHAAARARLETGDNTTDWLPWPEQNASATATWNPPAIGECWVILSPGGDLAQGIMALRLQTVEHLPPSSNPDEKRIRYPDGTEFSYNHNTHILTVNQPKEGSRLTIAVNGHASIDAETIDLGRADALQKSVLGDHMADAMANLIEQINQSSVIDSQGGTTSTIAAVKAIEVPDLVQGGKVYSEKNRNQ